MKHENTSRQFHTRQAELAMINEQKNIPYAPVLIPTLCRDQHFIRCVESLKKNTWARFTDVYIALDYPAKEEHRDGYNKICSYLSEGDFSIFHDFHVVKREKNYGVNLNSRMLTNDILTRYDRFIRTDDDIEFSPDFLEYMDKCLAYYEKDPTVIGVTGYSHPVNWEISEGSNTFKLGCLAMMWGIGFWRDSFLDLYENLHNGCLRDEFDEAVRTKAIYKMIDASFIDYLYILSEDSDRDLGLLNGPSDIAVGIYMQLHDRYMISPVLSKARNWGFDGSGIYCGNTLTLKNGNTTDNYNYRKQQIDQSVSFTLRPDPVIHESTNRKILNEFYYRSMPRMIKGRFKLWLYKTVGKEQYRKSVRCLKQYAKLANKIIRKRD